MRYWLMKSEPDEASIDDLANAAQRTLPWTGVRNYQARNFMRDIMKIGDGVLFYHSSCPEPGIAGIAEVSSTSYPDPTQFDPKDDHCDPESPRDAPRWFAVDIAFDEKFPRPVTLPELRADAVLGDMVLLRKGSRLSVQPVTAAEWKRIVKLGARK